ncbi:unnamed protein product, partial [Ranitomeya imitator]
MIPGTAYYIAPEVILQKGFGRPVDWWSIGIILYTFLLGFVPFDGHSTIKVLDNICRVILDSVVDPEGRFVFLKLARRARELILANVYFPNQGQQKFGSMCKKLLEKFAGDSPIILGGDFNLPMDPLIDVST